MTSDLPFIFQFEIGIQNDMEDILKDRIKPLAPPPPYVPPPLLTAE